MTNLDREREIHRRVNERYLVLPGDRWAYAYDAEHHADLHRARELLAATDQAMAAEGISAETRDRVVYRLLYGEAPAAYEAPDWREAATRAVDRDLATLQLMQTPSSFTVPPELFGEVSG